MPALTVKNISSALSEYVRADQDIIAKLNLVMPRIYGMGSWRDLLFDWTITTDNDYFSLPEDAETVMGAMVSDSPVDVQAQWHDYRISGYATNGPAPIFGVIDDGWHPIKEDLVSGHTYDITINPYGTGGLDLPSEGTITFEYESDGDAEDGVPDQRAVVDLDGSSSLSGVVADVINVHSISANNVSDSVEILAIDQDTADEIRIAVVRGNNISRYRRYRFQNADATTKTVRLLLKRAWTPVYLQTDTVHLGNLNAIKNGLLATVAEDNADIERAQYHWMVCRQLLEEELSTARGSAKPKLSFNPYGVGGYIPNVM